MSRNKKVKEKETEIFETVIKSNKQIPSILDPNIGDKLKDVICLIDNLSNNSDKNSSLELKDKYNDIKIKYNNLKKDFKKIEIENENLINEFKNLKEENIKLNVTLSEREKYFDNNTKTKREIEKLNNENIKLNNKIIDLNNEIFDYRQKINTYENSSNLLKGREDVINEMQKILNPLLSIYGGSSTTTSGKKGEIVVENILSNLFKDAIVENVGKTSNSGDLIFTLNDFKCLVEVKNKDKITPGDIEKFNKNINDNKYSAGLFISLKSHIPKKPRFPIRLEFVDGIPVTYIINSKEEQDYYNAIILLMQCIPKKNDNKKIFGEFIDILRKISASSSQLQNVIKGHITNYESKISSK